MSAPQGGKAPPGLRSRPWVVAVRAALPSPRPQGWQALQQAVGLASLPGPTVTLVGDAAQPDAGPGTLADWLGDPPPHSLRVEVPGRPARPPLAGVRFRRALDRARRPDAVLLCRDPRVAAREVGRGWAAVLMEWHVRPDPTGSRLRDAMRADLHISPAPGLIEDLVEAGVPEGRRLLLANACGLSLPRAEARLAGPSGRGVLVLGLHRRGGLDEVLTAWGEAPDLPPLLLAGRDQGGERWSHWRGRIADDARLRGRVRLLGPIWGAAREALLDTVGMWLAPYPADDFTRTRLCPLQVADALGAGIPVVAPPLPSIRALAGSSPFHSYEPGDRRSLVGAVREAVEHPRIGRPSERPRWIDRARELVQAASMLPGSPR